MGLNFNFERGDMGWYSYQTDQTISVKFLSIISRFQPTPVLSVVPNNKMSAATGLQDLTDADVG